MCIDDLSGWLEPASGPINSEKMGLRKRPFKNVHTKESENRKAALGNPDLCDNEHYMKINFEGKRCV